MPSVPPIMTAQVGIMTDEHENTDLGQSIAGFCDPQTGYQLEYGNVKARVHLPDSDERQPVKNGASDMTIAAAAGKGSSVTPPFCSSSSSSSSFEHLHSTLAVSSVDRDQGSLSDQALTRLHFDGDGPHQGINEARLRYQQAKVAFHANSSKSVGPGSSSTSMDSVSSASFARKAGPQPLVKLPQRSKNTPYRMGLFGRHCSVSSVSQHESQSASPKGTAISTPISPSQNKPSYTYQHASPLSPDDAHHAFNSPAPDSSSNYKYSRSRPHHNQDHVMRPAFGSNRRFQDDWTKWVELGLKISGLPPSTTTRDLYRCFSQEGNVVLIELYENTRSEREGTACVRFRYAFSCSVSLEISPNLTCNRPPPTRPFWDTEKFQIAVANHGTVSVRLYLEHRRRNFLHPSPVNPHKKYPESMVQYSIILKLEQN